MDEDQQPANDYFQSLPLDYRIGSVHLLHSTQGEIVDIDTRPEVFREHVRLHLGGDLKRVVLAYFDKLMRMIGRGGFDFIGHADKISYNVSCCEPDILGQQWYNYRYFYYRPMSIGRDAAVAYSDALKPYNIARTTSTYDVDRLGEFMLSYKKEFGRHHFDALAGYTLQRKTYDRLGVQATGFADDRIHEVTAHGSEATDVQLYDTRKAGWAMMSFLTRVNYAFDDRYTLTASFRADGSSRFGVDSRWGYFPSVSAGWTLSNEPFLKDALERVASIRLRASWGKSGNNDIGNYASIASISTGSYAFGNTPVSTTYEGSFADAALGWETTTQTNIGIDLGFLGGSVHVIGTASTSVASDVP